MRPFVQRRFAGLILLIAALVVASLARGRSSRPSRSNAARREARRAHREPHPMSMSENEL